MSKYLKLKEFLSRTLKQEDDKITISFSDIEDILDFELPPSAREHSAWWSNSKKRHSHAVWVDVDVVTSDVDLVNEKVTFTKSESNTSETLQYEKETGRTLGSTQEVIDRMESHVSKLILNFDEYLANFDEENKFTGPSQHFHLRTIQHVEGHSLSDILSDEDDPFYELLYATLTSWGMHMMGPKGAKLVDYDSFRDSIMEQKADILKLEGMSILSLSEKEVPDVREQLWTILSSMNISATKSNLVANTKTLHHMLPQLVPPIDRQYTLMFFYKRTNNMSEKKVFHEIYPHIYHIAQKCEGSIEKTTDNTTFHSSPTKVIDNSIVGYVLKEIK